MKFKPIKMKALPCLLLIFIQILFLCRANGQTPNTLTKKEQETGWHLLFDGKTLNGWRKLTDSGWIVENGELKAVGGSIGKQMDIITMDQYDNFELVFEFKISQASNSGVKYLVTNDYPEQKGAYLGLEYQILDDINFVYPDRGELRTLSSLYDLIPATKKPIKPLGKWNTARIIVANHEISHWLNDSNVVRYQRDDAVFKELVKKSKYKNLKNFGKMERGHILLQNEGSPISFRNIKIKKR